MKSTLLRNLMDNMYNQNFGRYAVLEGQANLDDLLTQRPGGVVRVKSPNAVMPLATPPLEPYSFQMLEYLDSVRESRAGVSRMSQGLDENALTSHTTATAVNAVMNASQSRVELIARNFAETGVKGLMARIYQLLLKNQDKERVVMLRNEWVPVRPDAWNDKFDCTVSVALGNGNKDQQLSHLTIMLQFAGDAMRGGLPIVSMQNMYNIGAAMVRNMGFQNVSDFLTDPSQSPQDQGPSQEEKMAEMEMQLKQKELEIKAADIQVKQMKIQQVAASDAVDAELKMQELQLEREQKRAVAIGDT
jgi:ribosomal protein S28E/S33